MKDWDLQPSVARPNVKYLTHCECIIAKRREDGSWYCPCCGIDAPEEIEFVADLANCEPYTGAGCYNSHTP